MLRAHSRRMITACAVLATVVVTAMGGQATAATATSSTSPTVAHALTCKSGYYKNVSGHCVHRPVKAAKAPAGATAKCRDGSYSFSEHASGTCSHHGGVAKWIHHP
jgi:hypothetical protein